MAGLPGNNACVNVGATVVLQRANHRIGVDLIARAIQITGAVVIAEIISDTMGPSLLRMLCPPGLTTRAEVTLLEAPAM